MKKKTMISRLIWAAARYGLLNRLSDKRYLKLMYRIHIGEPLKLDKPTSFNEKLQWLKLYDRRPEYPLLVDKYEVRAFVAQRIGEQYLFPLVGVWNHPDDVVWDMLPDQFVLKCTHDSGGVVICREKAAMDWKLVRKKLLRAYNRNFYYQGREWPYQSIRPRIIAEPLMQESAGKELRDYKLMVFQGNVRCCFVCSNRTQGLNVTFFDRNWNRMPFERHYPQDPRQIEKPQSYDDMVVLAERLAAGIPFVRVDFYEIDGNPYFGEMTFYPGSGFEEFTPPEWDHILGDWLTLPQGGKTI